MSTAMSAAVSDPPASGAGDAAEAPTPPDLLDFSGLCLVRPPLSEPIGAAAPAADAAVLAARLCEVSFADRVAFLPDAPSAWRTMADTVRAHHRLAGRPRRQQILLCMDGAATGLGPAAIRALGDALVLPPDDIGAVRGAVDTRTAAIVTAPVRTDGVFSIAAGSVLAELREIADEYGLVLVFDETAGGLGRTGMMWAHEWSGVTPDVMICAEGLAGARPMAALLATARVGRACPALPPPADALAWEAAAALMANPLAPGFEARLQALAWRLEDGLSAAMYRHRDLIMETGGVGLLQALWCRDEVAPALAARLADAGVATRTLGAAIAFLPPLDVTEGEIDAAMARLATVLAGCAAAE